MKEFARSILAALLLAGLSAPLGAAPDETAGGAGNGERYRGGVISYRTHGSLGMPPIFDLHLFEDGLAVYVGRALGEDDGIRKTSTETGHFIQAREMFGPLATAAAAVKCEAFGLDAPATSVEMRTPAGFQELSYDYGCYPSADAFLEELEAMESVLPVAAVQKAERAQVLSFHSYGKTVDAPFYEVTLFADGLMIFDGRHNVAEEGAQRLQIDPEVYRAVSKEFAALLALEKANSACGPNSGGNAVTGGAADLVTDLAQPANSAAEENVHGGEDGPYIFVTLQTTNGTDLVAHDSGFGEHSAEFHTHLAKLESLLSLQDLIGRKQ